MKKLAISAVVIIAALVAAPYFVGDETEVAPPKLNIPTIDEPSSEARRESVPVRLTEIAEQAEPDAVPVAKQITTADAMGSINGVVVDANGNEMETGDISGRVVDFDTGRPVPGAGVTFRWLGPSDSQRLGVVGEHPAAKADQEGEFRASDLPAGKWIVGIAHDPYMQSGTHVDIEAGRTISDVVINAVRGAVISGRVYDMTTGDGIPQIALSTAGREVATDADGVYRFAGLERGRYVVEMNNAKQFSPLLRSDRREVFMERGDEVNDMDFPLHPGITISGKLVDPQGRPVGGVGVRGVMGKYIVRDYRWFEDATALTGPDGGFVMTGFGPNLHISIEAVTQGAVAGSRLSMQIQEDDVSGVTVVMYPTESRISGHLVEAGGRRIANASIYYQVTTTGNPPVSAHPAPVTTDSGGGFTIDHLPAGHYELKAILPGQEAHSKNEVTLAALELGDYEQLDGLELVYDPEGGLAIAGLITDTLGAPVSGAEIYAHGPTTTQATSDQLGFYVLSPLLEGDYWLTVDKEATRKEGIRFAAGTLDADILLSLPQDNSFDYSIRGRVIDAETDAPITSFEYAIQPVHPGVTDPPDTDGLSENMIRGFRQVHDGAGQFLISSRHVSEYKIFVRARGYAGRFERVRIEPGPQKEYPVVFELAPPAVVEGRVLDDTGAPVEGASILPGANYNNRRANPHHTISTTDSDGHFRIDWLEGVPQTLAALHEDFGSAESLVTPVSGTTTEITMKLSAVATVEGEFFLDGALWRDQIETTLNYIDGEMNLRHSTGAVTEGGAYRIPRLPRGDVTVSATPDPYGKTPGPRRTMKRAAFLENNRVTKVDFDFQNGSAVLQGGVLLDGAAPTIVICTLTYSLPDGEDTFSLAYLNDAKFRFTNLPPGEALLTVRGTMASKADLRRPQFAEPFATYTEYFEVIIPPGEVDLTHDVDLSSETSEAWFSHR